MTEPFSSFTCGAFTWLYTPHPRLPKSSKSATIVTFDSWPGHSWDFCLRHNWEYPPGHNWHWWHRLGRQRWLPAAGASCAALFYFLTGGFAGHIWYFHPYWPVKSQLRKIFFHNNQHRVTGFMPSEKRRSDSGEGWSDVWICYENLVVIAELSEQNFCLSCSVDFPLSFLLTSNLLGKLCCCPWAF